MLESLSPKMTSCAAGDTYPSFVCFLAKEGTECTAPSLCFTKYVRIMYICEFRKFEHSEFLVKRRLSDMRGLSTITI